MLEGNCSSTIGGGISGCGETPVFWQDLSTAKLVDVTVPIGVNYPSITTAYNISQTSTPSLGNWMPAARLGLGNYVYVYSAGSANYYGVSAISAIGWAIGDGATGSPNLTVQQAHDIDAKIDDGIPQSGNVSVCYLNYDVVHYQPIWAAGKGQQGAGGANCAPTMTATAGAATNCFDNGNVAGTQQYSLANNAAQPNCGLSFRFQ